jgi:hypothetical protein
MLKRSKAIVFVLMLGVTGCTSSQLLRPLADVPEKLKPSVNESLAMIVPAVGVQIYECRAIKEEPGTYKWAFMAPEAGLFDVRGNRIGRNYAGPHWEANDGSKIAGTVRERANAPEADAIPWLLLGAKSTGSDGLFSKVTSVQRVNTVGGVAPDTGCSQATAGKSVHIAYAADYYFFTDR